MNVLSSRNTRARIRSSVALSRRPARVLRILGSRNQTSRPALARPSGRSTSAAPPFSNPSRSLSETPRSHARRAESSGSWPTSAIVAVEPCEASAARIVSRVPCARAGSILGSRRPKVRAAMPAVARARASGLLSSTSGGSTIQARPPAALRNSASPSAVSWRSPSGTPGVPPGTAAAWRMSSSFMARAPLPDSLRGVEWPTASRS